VPGRRVAAYGTRSVRTSGSFATPVVCARSLTGGSQVRDWSHLPLCWPVDTPRRRVPVAVQLPRL
jgi:hypothetical protein